MRSQNESKTLFKEKFPKFGGKSTMQPIKMLYKLKTG